MTAAKATRGWRRRADFACHLGLAVWLCTGTSREAEWMVVPERGLDASGFPLGPFLPASSTYLLSNASDGVLDWAAGKSAPWIGLSESRGSLMPSNVASITVLINSRALELPAGDHQASVSFTNLGGGEAVIARDVHLRVALPPPPNVEWVMIASNALVIPVTGQPGAEFYIETSTNAIAWSRTYTNTLSSGAAIFHFTLTAEPLRLYRALCPDANVQAPHLSITNETTYEQSRTRLQVTGEPGSLFRLEASSDQLHWTPVATNKLCGTDHLVYTIPSDQGTGLTYQVRVLDTPPLEPAHHILIVGQSLAIGAGGVPALSTVASDFHLRFSSRMTGSDLSALNESVTETIASSTAQQASLHAPFHRLLLSNVGQGAAAYELLKKGTDNYALGLQQFREAAASLACRLLGYRPSALFAVHGEGDAGNAHYDLDIRQWQADYEADVRDLTGSEVTLPMFHTQIAAWTSSGSGTAISPYKVLAESEANPTKTILVGPRYFLAHAPPDGLHLNNYGYRWLGAYYGKVYRRVVIDGGRWTPLKPVLITRTGAVITAKFDVPAPPLVLDTHWVSDPGNFGFEYHDDSPSPPAIAAVETTDPETVQITLSSPPTGGNPRLRYAYSGIPNSPGGPFTGPRGNLRDSDPETSLSGEPLYNWCVHFDRPIE